MVIFASQSKLKSIASEALPADALATPGGPRRFDSEPGALFHVRRRPRGKLRSTGSLRFLARRTPGAPPPFQVRLRMSASQPPRDGLAGHHGGRADVTGGGRDDEPFCRLPWAAEAPGVKLERGVFSLLVLAR